MSALDELLAEAREAEPEALSERALAALLENARGGGVSSVERLVAAARRADPAPISDRERDSMVERASMVGRARHRSWTRRRVLTVSASVAALAAAAAVWLGFALGAPSTDPARASGGPSDEGAGAASAEPTQLELSTGDRLLAGADARFEVEPPSAGRRRVHLSRGAMLFDVRTLPGGRFTVSTAVAEVTVLGTVFTVAASPRGTSVWVYEGRVRVESAGRARELTAGDVLHLGAAAETPSAAGAATVSDDPMGEAGARAAAQRAAPASPVAAVGPRAGASAPSEPESVEAPRVVEAAARPPRAAPAAPLAPPADPADVRAAIARGDAGRALEVIRASLAHGERDPFQLLEGDALRALGRTREAADAYHRAAAVLPAPRRQQAGFLEARLQGAELGDARAALRALDEADVCEARSPLRERGLELEVRLHSGLGEVAEARQAAARYLESYPEGPSAPSMQALLGR